MAILSLGEFLWSLLAVFFMVIYFMAMLQVIVDVFRRQDASGWTKAAWILFLIAVPLLGLVIYMVTNSQGMAMRAARGQAEVLAAADASAPVDEIKRAHELLDSGAITPTEYARLKEKALA